MSANGSKLSLIFIDFEGRPLQEVGAIEVDDQSKEIVDVYHKFADCKAKVDHYCRLFVHGLNPWFLSVNGFCNEKLLIADFKQWLSTKTYRLVYSNDASFEGKVLYPLHIEELTLPPWLQRVNEDYHQEAFRRKQYRIPVHNVTCDENAHTYYRRPYYWKNETAFVKANHGHHCALYDCYELYLYYLKRVPHSQ